MESLVAFWIYTIIGIIFYCYVSHTEKHKFNYRKADDWLDGFFLIYFWWVAIIVAIIGTVLFGDD